MKKTLIAFFALSLIAQAESVTTVLTLGEPSSSSHSSVTDHHEIENTGATTITLTDGSTLALGVTSPTKFWANGDSGKIAGTWTNTAALADMNSTLGTAFTAEDLSTGSSLQYTATGGGGTKSTATLTLGDFAFADRSKITLYITATAREVALGNFTVSGLADQVVTYATNTGDGFTTTATFSSAAKELTMIKVTGTVTSNSIVMASTTAKNGWQTISYVVTPEPATATLSLLALAALASRRKRH